MTSKKSTKRALISSLLILAMCFTMLAGTTFAWFTDSVESIGNKIVAGKLDIALYMADAQGTYNEITNSTSPIFGQGSIAQNNNAETLWEPGKTQIAYLKLENKGNLALKYKVAITVKDNVKDLYKVMTYAIVPDAAYDTVTAMPANAQNVVLGTQDTALDVAMQPGDVHLFALAVHMDEQAGNEYQEGEVSFDMIVLATQLASEYDSFSNQYDANAEYPGVANVANATELAAAIADPTVDSIVLEDDVDNAGWVNLSTGSKTIDLNGHELDGSVYAYGDSSVTIGGGEITGTVYVDSDANLTIEDDATTGSVILYNSADEATINIYGKVEGYLWVMGNITDSASVINFYGEIETDDDIGLALAGDATVNIYDGAKIKSTTGTGIEVRAGNLNVYGGTIEGNGAFTITPNGSGTTTTGCGIAVCQHTTKLPINVNISGGTITGSVYGLYEANPQQNDPYGPVVINVTGGTITGGTQNIVRL